MAMRNPDLVVALESEHERLTPPAVLPTYTGWRWVCPTCQAWGRTETRWGARRALKRHQRTCQAPRIIWERMDLYTGRGL